MDRLLLCVCLLGLAASYDAHRILVVFPFPSKSHSILGDGVVRHLLKGGQMITYITPFPWKSPPKNFTQIDVSSNIPAFKAGEILNITNLLEGTMQLNNPLFIIKIAKDAALRTIEHGNVQKLIWDTSQRFDAVIAEWMISDIYFGFAQIYACPHIMYTASSMNLINLGYLDEEPNPAYILSEMFGHLPPFTFLGRVKELFVHTFFLVLKQKALLDTATDYDRLFSPILKNQGRELPTLAEARNNVSLALVNTHVSLVYAPRIPLNYIPIGGYHIDTDVKPLPKDLQVLMDKAQNGVIYFSMGSNLKSKDLPNKLKTSLLQMFGSLKQTVIWKFEENLLNVPKNVHIVQWAPQPSILAHPNCVLFISHGGLLSITETIHFAVPVIGIPVFADQFLNVDLSVVKGFAKRVDLKYNMAEDLKEAIDDILLNPKYKQAVKKLSLIYHHRAVPPGKLLVHEVEHVILTGGAPHLRSPASMTLWYQKLYLDLAGLLLALVLCINFIAKAIFRKTYGNNKKRQDKKKIKVK